MPAASDFNFKNEMDEAAILDRRMRFNGTSLNTTLFYLCEIDAPIDRLTVTLSNEYLAARIDAMKSAQ